MARAHEAVPFAREQRSRRAPGSGGEAEGEEHPRHRADVAHEALGAGGIVRGQEAVGDHQREGDDDDERADGAGVPVVGERADEGHHAQQRRRQADHEGGELEDAVREHDVGPGRRGDAGRRGRIGRGRRFRHGKGWRDGSAGDEARQARPGRRPRTLAPGPRGSENRRRRDRRREARDRSRGRSPGRPAPRQAFELAEVARLLPLQGRGRHRRLRGQGQEPALAGEELLPGGGERRALLHPHPPPHRARPGDGRHQQREGSGGPRERSHQAAPAALQRQAARRQGLPLPPPRSAEGLAPAGDGAPPLGGRRALLRPVPLGDERAAHAAPRQQALPAPHLHRRGDGRAAAAVPPVPDQALPGAVRARRRPRLLRRDGAQRRPLPRGRATTS